MERYIKVDELEAIIKATDWSNPAVPIVLYMIIDRCSTADVAPRSEVAMEIFAGIEKIINENYDKAQDNEEDEELEAATDYLSYVSCDLDDFKKKYTEEQK